MSIMILPCCSTMLSLLGLGLDDLRKADLKLLFTSAKLEALFFITVVFGGFLLL